MCAFRAPRTKKSGVQRSGAMARVQAGGRCYLVASMVALFSMVNCSKEAEHAAHQSDGKTAAAAAAWEKVAEGLNFPEGPAWDGKGALYFSNCYGGWITRLAQCRADTFLIAQASPLTFDKTNGMAFHQGHLFACDFGIGAILRISPEGRTEIYAGEFQGKAFNRPNDLAFDAAGNLHFSDPKSYSREVLDGRIFCRNAEDGKIVLLADRLGFPNGLAFSTDGKKLFVCESAFERILSFEIERDGRLSRRQVFVNLPGGDPDGIDCDREGNLYVAHFGGGAVYVIAPDGSMREKIPAPGKKPTNIEFGGEDLQTLFLTEVETNALYQRRLEIAGAAKNFAAVE